MNQWLKIVCVPVAGLMLMGAEPATTESGWKNKPFAQWSETDAKQILAGSPWVKLVTPAHLRDLSVAERRDSGDWQADVGRGVGIAGTGLLGTLRMSEAIARAHEKPPAAPVIVRWESALPVRIAEQKGGDARAPVLKGDDYAIVIYDIPMPHRPNQANELKGIASLKRSGKKDLRPSRVEILRKPDGTATIVYLFPRSQEITKKDGSIEFVAQVGRLFVEQFFDTKEMQVRGELELLMPSNDTAQ